MWKKWTQDSLPLRKFLLLALAAGFAFLLRQGRQQNQREQQFRASLIPVVNV